MEYGVRVRGRHIRSEVLKTRNNIYFSSTLQIWWRPVFFIEAGQDFKISSHAGVMSKQLLPVSNHEDSDERLIIFIKFPQTKKASHQNCQSKTFFFILFYYTESSLTREISWSINQLAESYSQEHVTALLACLLYGAWTSRRASWWGKNVWLKPRALTRSLHWSFKRSALQKGSFGSTWKESTSQYASG